MFEYEYLSGLGITLAIVIAVVFFLVGAIVSVTQNDDAAFKIVGVIFSLVIAVFMGVIATMLSSSIQTRETNNPNYLTEHSSRVMYSSINDDEMNDFIKQSTGYDRVSVDLDARNVRVNDFAEGKIINFTALDNDTKIDGSFYFDDDKMVIITSDEHEMTNKWTVGVN